MTKRNNLVEFIRFLFSLLVVGYHVQMSFVNGGTDLFENGALAVEFFFILSGYFFAKSVNKVSRKNEYNFIKESFNFMKSKIKGILFPHIAAIIMMLIVILIFDLSNFTTKFIDGLPSIFLVQMFVVWNNSFNMALIVPEWYLSAMIVSLLFMAPIAFLSVKRIKVGFIPLILLGVLGVIVLIGGFAMKWKLTVNFIYILRAWGEMCVGMFAYIVAEKIRNIQIKKFWSNALKVIEFICYLLPLVLGFAPLPESALAPLMAVTVVMTFIAITITFSDNGVSIKNDKVNAIFGWLGKISLAIYLFHPIVISAIGYINIELQNWMAYLIVFAIALIMAALYNVVSEGIKRLIKNIKNKKIVMASTAEAQTESEVGNAQSNGINIIDTTEEKKNESANDEIKNDNVE